MESSYLTREFEQVNQVIERLAGELVGFVQVCGVGEPFRAEQICIDLLNEAVARGEFHDPDAELSPLRERLLADAYRAAKNNVHVVADMEYERFFSLPQIDRAAIHLRHRIGLTFAAISRVLSLPEREVRDAVLHAREHLLGRPLSKIDWGF